MVTIQSGFLAALERCEKPRQMLHCRHSAFGRIIALCLSSLIPSRVSKTWSRCSFLIDYERCLLRVTDFAQESRLMKVQAGTCSFQKQMLASGQGEKIPACHSAIPILGLTPTSGLLLVGAGRCKQQTDRAYWPASHGPANSEGVSCQ